MMKKRERFIGLLRINRNMRCIEILQYFEVSYLNKSNILKFYIKGSTGYQKSSMVKREDKKC